MSITFSGSITIAVSCLAALLSYIVNHSISWAILHFIMGWVYLVYWIIEYSKIPEMIKHFLM